FWWISLLAKRVSAESSVMTRTSASVAPTRRARPRTSSARASASAAASSGWRWRVGSVIARSPLADADLDVAEARPGDPVADVAGLARLALAAVRRAEHDPARGVADRIAGPPELVRDAGVRRVLVELALLAALDLVGDLGRELEVQAAIVDRPAPVAREVQPVVRAGHDVGEAGARDRHEADVRHADERDAVPAVGPHGAARAATDPRRGLAARQVADEDAVLDERHGLRGDALVVPAECP